MNSRRTTATKAAEHSYVPSPIAPQGRWLFAFRAVWAVVSVLALGLFVASLPLAYAQYHTACVAGYECPWWRLSPEEANALQEAGLSTGFYAAYRLANDVVFAVGFCLVGAAIVWRKPSGRMPLFASLALVTFGTATTPVQVLAEISPVWGLPATLVIFLGTTLFLVFFCLFPDGRFVPHWSLALAAVWVVYQGARYFFPGSPFDPQSWSRLLDVLSMLALFGGLAFAQVYRYVRVSRPIERQQTKWVVFGLAAAILVFAGLALPVGLFPTLAEPGTPGLLYSLGGMTLANLGFLCLPVSIGVAVLRYRLFDIDPLINRTLVYGLLTACLAALYGTSVVVLQGLFRAFTGQETDLAIVASTLAIAVLFQPLRRRIQNFTDRRFYRRKYDAAMTLDAFGARLREEVDLDRLSADLLAVTKEALEPAHVSLWLRPPKEDE